MLSTKRTNELISESEIQYIISKTKGNHPIFSFEKFPKVSFLIFVKKIFDDVLNFNNLQI